MFRWRLFRIVLVDVPLMPPSERNQKCLGMSVFALRAFHRNRRSV
jgi:hypothetical protein